MRLISLCLALCLVFCCVVPVSAAEEISVHFENFDNSFFVEMDEFPYLNSSFSFSIVLNFSNFSTSVSNFTSSFQFIEEDGLPYYITSPFFVSFDFNDIPVTYSLVFAFGDLTSSGLNSLFISPSDSWGVAPDSIDVTFYGPGFDYSLFPSVALFLNVLGWFGLVLTGITSGKLSVLWSICCVGIAVALVFVVIKIIKRFSWGT